MTVDTSSADDWTVRDGAKLLAIESAVAAGESVLADRFGSAISLVDVEDLAGSGPATVVRTKVASSPFSLPRTLVVKHYPPAPGGDQPDPFAHEAASYQLFNALAPEDRVCPELLAHDATQRVLVIDDLGRAPTLQDKLHGTHAKAAEHGLLAWAHALGKLHASTAGREADFHTLLRRLASEAPAPAQARSGIAAERGRAHAPSIGAAWRDDGPAHAIACAQLPALLEEILSVTTPDSVRTEAERAAEYARSTAHRAFSPVDLAPDNNLLVNDGARFLDFEHGLVRNTLMDVGYLHVPFASCADVRALPPGMSDAMVAAWRAETADVWPMLTDDDELTTYLLHSQLLLVWLATWESLPGLGTGVAAQSSRAAALVTWWGHLATHAERAGCSAIAAHAQSVAGRLDARHGPGLQLALYPAFR